MSLRPTQPLQRKPADPAAAGELVASVLGARVHIDVTVPRTEVRGRMRVLTRAESKQVRSEARRECQRLGLKDEGLEYARDFMEEVGTRSVAIAVRQPGNEALALAALEEWERCDEDQIAALWQIYKDLEESLDPIGVGCTEAEFLVIEDAAKKKAETVLRSFGSRKLAAYAITSAARPAS